MVIAAVPVDITWSYGTGSPGRNTWHVRTDGDLVDGEQIAGLIEDIQSFYEAINTLMHVNWSARFAGVVNGLGTDEGDTGTYPAWQVDGDATGDVLPTSNQIVVGWRASTGGRRGRGRTFLGPLQAVVLDPDGLPTQASIDVIQNAANNLVAASTGTLNGAVGVYSRTDGLVRDVVAATVRREFAVLRSRRD